MDQFTNLGGSRLAIASGAASIDHLDAISDSEVAELADSETIGVVIPTENFNGGKTQFANARKMIDQGIRAVWLMSSVPPGGVSPAHSSLDPLWSLLADADVAADGVRGGSADQLTLLRRSGSHDMGPPSGAAPFAFSTGGQPHRRSGGRRHGGRRRDCLR